VSEPVFKIVPRAEWAEVTSAYKGSAHDQSDGFLHFSTRMQLLETLKRYYTGQTDLMLVAVDTEKFGAHLKWEYSPSRGEDFPHLYGALPLDAVIWAKPIGNGADGEFLLPG
jgi:uncharacterized protein (DUF952 family)